VDGVQTVVDAGVAQVSRIAGKQTEGIKDLPLAHLGHRNLNIW
jgi:hypothetical protein